MKIRRPIKEMIEVSPADMDLEQLKKLLRRRGDAQPEYMFASVAEATDTRDYRYVFWLDLMGARNLMKLSLPRASRSIMKIHAAALLAKQKYSELEINPVMDGVYGYVKNRELLEACLTEIISCLANAFIQERFPNNRFLVRAGVAFGPIVPGSSLAAGAAILRKNKRYLGGTAIGMGISHAYEAEGNAPPFGVYIHESARAFAPKKKDSYPFYTNLWQWFRPSDALTWALRRTLLEHFDWLEKNPVTAHYDLEVMRKHKSLAVEYFKLHELMGTNAENK